MAQERVDWKKTNWLMLGAAALLLVGFFVPWVNIQDGEEFELLAGFQIAGFGGPYTAVYLVPLLALGMGIAALKAPSAASAIGALTGAALVGWGLFEVARFLYVQTFWGLWVSVAGALLAVIGGAFTWRRAHTAVAQAKAAARAAREAASEVAKQSRASQPRIEP